MAERIRVAVCDDAKAVKLFLTHMLEEEGDIVVVSATSTGGAALREVAQGPPDVLLLDLLLPDVPEPLELVGELRRVAPEMAIVLISNMPPFRLEEEAGRLRTDAWIAKASKPEELREAVRSAARSRRDVVPGRQANLDV